ncbi:nucleolar transcription factor 1-A-like [Phyllobates terribilis]|uniref:nucleolar transcription factor 1-A-like n=1 Tax=Phyllobates terribilis TaxID=111132 RepID=UPI003CCB0FBF
MFGMRLKGILGLLKFAKNGKLIEHVRRFLFLRWVIASSYHPKTLNEGTIGKEFVPSVVSPSSPPPPVVVDDSLEYEHQQVIQDAEEHVKHPYKGKKLKKHPEFPKKPLTPYFRFFMEKRAKYAKLHPEMSNLDLTKILSKKYKELPEKKKMKYVQDFQREKLEFERNLAKFREEHPDLMQTNKKSDVPEKPKTPQQLWYNHERKVYLKIKPDASTKDVKDALAKQWSQLSDKKRLKWIHKELS